MSEDKEWSTYWVIIKPTKYEKFLGNCEIEFNNFDEAKKEYDELVDLYNVVEFFEEKHIVIYKLMDKNYIL